MMNERNDIYVMIIAFVSGGVLSVVNNPMLGIVTLMGMLMLWTVVKKIPEFKKIKIDK